MIEAVKAHSPLRAVIGEVIRLEKDKGLCPFHPDKHPSFFIKGERWRCFPCGEGGDVIDFTAKYYGLDTKGAIRLLADRAGIKPANTQAEKIAAEKARKEREERRKLIEAFREWEQQTVNEIAPILRAYRHMKETKTAFTEVELVTLAELQGEIDRLEYVYEEILCRKDDEAKFGLYREMTGCRISI